MVKVRNMADKTTQQNNLLLSFSGDATALNFDNQVLEIHNHVDSLKSVLSIAPVIAADVAALTYPHFNA